MRGCRGRGRGAHVAEGTAESVGEEDAVVGLVSPAHGRVAHQPQPGQLQEAHTLLTDGTEGTAPAQGTATAGTKE